MEPTCCARPRSWRRSTESWSRPGRPTVSVLDSCRERCSTAAPAIGRRCDACSRMPAMRDWFYHRARRPTGDAIRRLARPGQKVVVIGDALVAGKSMPAIASAFEAALAGPGHGQEFVISPRIRDWDLWGKCHNLDAGRLDARDYGSTGHFWGFHCRIGANDPHSSSAGHAAVIAAAMVASACAAFGAGSRSANRSDGRSVAVRHSWPRLRRQRTLGVNVRKPGAGRTAGRAGARRRTDRAPRSSGSADPPAHRRRRAVAIPQPAARRRSSGACWKMAMRAYRAVRHAPRRHARLRRRPRMSRPRPAAAAMRSIRPTIRMRPGRRASSARRRRRAAYRRARPTLRIRRSEHPADVASARRSICRRSPPILPTSRRDRDGRIRSVAQWRCGQRRGRPGRNPAALGFARRTLTTSPMAISCARTTRSPRTASAAS